MKKRFWLAIFASLMIFSLSAKGKSDVKTVDTYSRIVALSPAASEILFAVGAGDQVVAVSDYTDYPAEAAALPRVGGFDGKTLSLESILSYKPDLVYLTDGMHNFLIESLNEYGIAYYLSKADSINSVKQEILDIGKLTGHSAQAQKVVDEMNEKLSKYENLKLNKARKPSVYYEVWNAPYMTAGNLSFINDVIVSAGCENLFGNINEAYPMISEEAIIAGNPIVIILPASSGVDAAAVAARAGWKDIIAVQNNKVFVIDDNVFTRPGPRIADCVETLYNLINE